MACAASASERLSGRVLTAPLVVVMGVCGCGKSTLAAALAQRLGWQFLEGDDCHPAANRQRMAAGLALDDRMREPWVAEVCRRVLACHAPMLLAFSGLRRAHRQRLRELRRNVMFLHLQLPTVLLEQRLRQRSGHFMPPELLGSQLSALEIPDGEPEVVSLDAAVPTNQLLALAEQRLSRWGPAQRCAG